MTPILIGIVSGLFLVGALALIKKTEQPIFYGLTLTAIGFLYVGFTWSDFHSFIICCLQALFFVFFSYLGIRKNGYYMAAGYFLHGLWDIGYDLLPLPDLRPPHYDLFCLSIDFTMGIFLVLAQIRCRNPK